MKKRILDLLNRNIDGVATPKDRLKLEKLVDSDPDIARLYADLRRLAEVLARSTSVDPPPSLKHAIMRNIEISLHSPEESPVVHGFHKVIQPFRALQGGRVFALGLVAGILVFAGVESILKTPGSGEGEMTGTMASPALTPGLVKVTHIDISQDKLTGAVDVSSSKDVSFLQVRVQGSGSLRAEVSYDPKTLHLNAVQTQGGGSSSTQSSEGRVELVTSSPDELGVFFAHLTGAQSLVRIRVLDAGGTVMFDRSLGIDPSRGH